MPGTVPWPFLIADQWRPLSIDAEYHRMAYAVIGNNKNHVEHKKN